MSEAFQPPGNRADYLPQNTAQPSGPSPWVLGCGAVAMAVLLLGMLGAVVGVLVMFAARGTDRGVQVRLSRPSLAEQRLADGSLLVLEQVTFGREHQFDDSARGAAANMRAGPASNSDARTIRTSEPMFVAWLTQWDSTGNARDFDWILRCAAVDAHGCEIESRDRGRYARQGSGSSSESGGKGPFSPLTGGPYDLILTHFELPAFRPDGASFKLRVYDTRNRKVAEFNVPDPRPAGLAYSEWEPEPLPITKSDGDVSLTLLGLTARTSESSQTINGISLTETRVHLNPVFETRQAGEPTGDWSNRSLRVFDALGNQAFAGDCRLCPKESAWKLEVKLWRNANALFDSDEVWSLEDVPVPREQPGYVNKSRVWDGAALQLVGVSGAGTRSYPGHGGYQISTSGTSYFGQGKDRRQVPYRIKIDENQTTIESRLPHVLVRSNNLSSDQQIAFRVRDGQGNQLPLDGPRMLIPRLYVWFIDAPADSQTLDLELCVHRCRTFRFLVAPPEIQQPAANVPAPSPRAAAQRLSDAQRAIAGGRRALAASPQDPDVLNNLAWALATAPEELRDAEQAVVLAQRAVQLQPENRNCINTLGVALCRAEQYGLAISTLEGNIGDRTDALVPFDLYPLAMAQFRSGQTDQAHATHQRALDQHRRSETELALIQWQELYEFRLEAATLLVGEPPAQVFERAGELARLGQWEPAAAEFARALNVYPVDHWPWYRSGALRAYLNDAEEYREHCRSMLDLFGETADPYIAERVGKLCLLLPGTPDERRAVQLCEKSLSQQPDVPWFHLAAAIASYRSGQYQEALVRLRTGEALAGDQLFCRVLIELFRAMSQHQLGEREAAQGSLEDARNRLNTRATTSQENAVDYGSSWHDHLMCEVVRREAESLLGGGATDSEPEATAPPEAPEPAEAPAGQYQDGSSGPDVRVHQDSPQSGRAAAG